MCRAALENVFQSIWLKNIHHQKQIQYFYISQIFRDI